MKPAPFAYHAPATVAEAIEVLGATEGKVLAGGQSLIPILNMRLAEPEHIVDINRITELAYIRSDESGVTVGALARHTEIERDADATWRLPILGQALRLVAHPVIRNRGTAVGSLVHADPAAELPAVLAALGGSVELAGANGTRTVAARDFFVGPLESAIEPGELAVSAYFPMPAGRTGSDVAELSRRHGDYALAGVASLVSVNGHAEARVASFGVGPAPIVVEVAGETGEISVLAARAVRAAAEPEDDIHATAAYRDHLVGVLAERSVRAALRRAQ
jgi:aerobic carbon-monoxide dehydrogenase medium subunit